MKVLVACEMSGIIREAFRKKGHEAYSCDILPTEIPSKYHIQDDVLNHLDKKWDLMIGHPVCTFICRNRARLNKKENHEIDTSLFMSLLNADIDKICIENPVPSKAAGLPKVHSDNSTLSAWSRPFKENLSLVEKPTKSRTY